MRKLKQYALYRGDELLDFGTGKELAERRGIKYKNLLFLLSPAYKKRRANSKRNILILIRIEDDEE